MVRYVWWSEHERLCASGVLTTVRGHFKGLQAASPQIRNRFGFAKLIAEKGRLWSETYLTSNAPCPDCKRPTHYYSRGPLEHAWFDTIGYKWTTHRCMAKPDTKCQPSIAALSSSPTNPSPNRRRLVLKKRRPVSAVDAAVRQKQEDSPIETNSTCSQCATQVYEFRSSSGKQAYFDGLFPDWPVHICEAKEKDKIEKTNSEFMKLADLGKVLNNPTVSPRLKPDLTDLEFEGLPYILCRVLTVTKHQNGFRLRLNPASLPKVDIVVFGRFLEAQVKGVNFVYLKNNCIKFLSQHSLKPLEADIEYYDIRSM